MTASDKSKDELRKSLRLFREHIEKDHPDPDMRECAWEDDIMQLIDAHTAAAVEEYKKAVGLKQQEINAEAQARKASL